MRGLLRRRTAAGGQIPPAPVEQRPLIALVEIEPAEYVDARTEARNLCRNLGLDVENEHWDKASIGDFVRLAYAQGYVACETRLASPDIADVIAQALDDPGSVLERTSTSESVPRWSVRAVQQVVAYGMPRDIHHPAETLEENRIVSQRTVWKYTVAVDPLSAMGTQVVQIPEGARFLHCEAQHSREIGLWYEVPDPATKPPTEQHGFQIFGTGNGLIGDHLKYVGTALFGDGGLVLHVYEVIYP